MAINSGHIRTMRGILEIFQIVFSLIAFICSLVVGWTAGMRWCSFVGIFCAVSVLVHLILIMTDISLRIPNYFIIVLVWYLIMAVFSLIAFIVAAVLTAQYYNWAAYYHYNQGALIAAAVFFLLATIVLVIDLIMQFRGWRVTVISQSAASSSSTTTSRTVVTRTVQ